MNREAIYSALFAKLSSVQGFNTVSRHLKIWNDVSPADQPALFMVQRSESAMPIAGRPTVWTMTVDLILYANTGGDRTVAPMSILNPLVDAVIAALSPDNYMTNKCTLGGLVDHAWVEGHIQTDEGILGPQGYVMIPIVIKAV